MFYLNTMRVSGFTAIILLWASKMVFGQSLKFDKLTPGDGLSQSTVNCIIQDHIGYLWIGTEEEGCIQGQKISHAPLIILGYL